MGCMNKRLIDVLDEFGGKDEVQDMVIGKLKKLYNLIITSSKYEDKDSEFVAPILNDLIRYPERRITKLEIQECNRLYKKYRSK
jgi:hypothetical protein